MILIFILYLLSSIIFTYPLILKLGSFLPGQPNDAYVYLWNIWSFWHQAFNFSNLFDTKYIMYPIGANLFFHTYAPLVSLFALPFLKNLSLYMGISIIISVALSSLSLYILALKITNNKTASFIGGLVYGLSPIINSFIQSQHYYFLFSSVYYPLGIYLLICFFKTNKIKYLYGTIGLFWLTLLTDYYSAVLYFLLVLVFFIFNEKFKLRKIFNYFLIILLSVIIPFYIFYETQDNFKEFVNYKQQTNSSSSCNTQLLGFITPNISNPLLKIKQLVNLDTPSYFIGWGIFAISIIAAFKYRKSKYINSFSIIFVIFFLLSLGTNIKLGEKILLDGKLTPFYYFLKLPILSSIDCTIRFPIIMQISVSILISAYVAQSKKIMRVATAVLILLFIEYSVFNKDFSSTEIPGVYNVISSEINTKTVLEIPSGISESKSAFGYDWSIQALHSQQMYWQTAYNKPRVGVYMSRLTPDKYIFFRNEPVISNIFNYSSAGGIMLSYDLSEDSIKNFVNKFNLGYIVLSPNSRQGEFSLFIEKEFKKYIKEKIVLDGFILYKL